MKLLLVLMILVSCSTMSEREKKMNKKVQTLKKEAMLGKRTAVRILKKYPRLNHAESQGYISNLGRSIIHRIGRQELYYYFAILDSKEKRSFSIPGGFVFITSGLIKSLKNEAQLVGILSREISHINHKHALAILKTESDMKKAADQTFKMITEKGYTAKQTKRAENDAVMALVSMKYDPKQFISVSQQRSYVKKLTTKVNNKLSQSAGKRFFELKKRI